MTKRLLRQCSAAFIAIIAFALSSCSSGDLLDTVPNDVDYVMTVDLDRLIENTGFQLTDNDIKAPQALQSAISQMPEHLRHEILLINKAIDLHRIVAAGYLTDNGADNYCVAKVKDHDELLNILEKELRSIMRTVDGKDFYYSTTSTFFHIDGKRVFIFTPAKGTVAEAARLLKKVTDQADKATIMKQKEATKLLTENRIANVAINTSTLADMISKYGYQYFDTKTAIMLSAGLPYLKDNWLAMWADIEKTTLTASAYMFNRETGERVTIPGLKEVDAETLKLLPANTILAGALAVDNAMLTKQLQMVEPMITDPVMKGAFKQLMNLDGTVAIGYGLNDRADVAELLTGDTFVGSLTMVATFKQGAGETVKMLKSLLTLFGEKISDEANGFSISANNMPPVHFTASGNHLIISTEQTVKPTDNGICGMINKANSGIVFNLPTLSKYLGTSDKAGLEASMLATDNQWDFKVEFTHTDEDLATTLTNLYPAFNQLAVEYMKPDAGFLPDDHAYAFDSDDPR